MKKILTLPLLGFLLVLAFMIFMNIQVFGFWNIVFTVFTSLFSVYLLRMRPGARMVKQGLIIYNPKEGPKYISIAVAAALGLYLLRAMLSRHHSGFEWIYGISFMVFLSCLPIVWAIYTVIRDRNDYITLGENSLSYRDNAELFEASFSEMVKAEKVQGDIQVLSTDGKNYAIKTSQMNFDDRDLSNVTADINAKISKAKNEK